MKFAELKRQGRCILLLAAVVNVLYFNTYLNSFHFDDGISIVDNTRLKDSAYFFQLFSGIKKTFSERPIVQASFLFNYQLCRLHVFGYHLFNVCAHSFAVVLVFFVSRYLALLLHGRRARNTLQDKSRSSAGFGFPFLAALFFALHPLHTESVVYISSRSEVLLTIFFLLAFLFFIQGIRSGRKKVFILLGSIFFLIGMATKQNFIAFPLITVLYLFFFHPEEAKKAIKKNKAVLILFFTAALGAAIALFLSQGEDLFYFSTVERQWTPHQYFYTELNVILYYYLKKLLFPFELSIDPLFPVSDSFFSYSLFSFLAIAGAMILAILKRRQNFFFGFGLCWIFLAISPTSSFVPLLDFVSEHRVYLPGVGLAIAAGAILVKRLYALPFTLALFVFFSILTMERNHAWKDTFSLWSDAMKKSPLKARPLNNLARHYQDTGKYEEALAAYQKAAALAPGAPFPYTGMGMVYLKLGRHSSAEENFKRALEIKPNDSDASTKLAQVYFETGALDKAEKLLTGVQLRDNQTDAFYLLGQIYSATNRPGAALREFFKAIKMDPDFSEAYIGVGIIHAGENKFEEAEKYFLKSLETRKNNPNAYLNLGYLYFLQKHYRKAIERYQQALKYNPEMAQARIYAGDAHMELKEYKEAAQLYFQVGRLMESQGHPELAAPYYQKAVRLDPERFSARQ